MSRGSNAQQNGKLFFLNVAGMKPGEEVSFKQVEALEDKKLKDLPNVKDVSGTVHKIETSTREWEGVAKTSIVLWLRDRKANEMCRVQCGLNRIGRSIINSMAGITGPIGEISLSVYNNKKTGKQTVKVRHNGDDASWKFSLDELRPYTKVTKTRVKGPDGKIIEKESYDNLDLDEFLLNVWNTTVKANVPLTDVAPKTSDGPSDGPKDDVGDEPVNTQVSTDDLPF